MRLVTGLVKEGAGARPAPSSPATASAARGTAPRTEVLLAGADAERRAALREELGASLPQFTRIAEADTVDALLTRAPASRVVILDGDLNDGDAESLQHLLGRRHPDLPVLRVDAPPLEGHAACAAAGRG